MRLHGGIKPITGLIKFSAPPAGVPPRYDLVASVLDTAGRPIAISKGGDTAVNFGGTVGINEFTYMTITFKVPVILRGLTPMQVYSSRSPQMQVQYTKDGTAFIPIDTTKGSLGRVFRYANIGDQFWDGKGSALGLSGLYLS